MFIGVISSGRAVITQDIILHGVQHSENVTSSGSSRSQQ